MSSTLGTGRLGRAAIVLFFLAVAGTFVGLVKRSFESTPSEETGSVAARDDVELIPTLGDRWEAGDDPPQRRELSALSEAERRGLYREILRARRDARIQAASAYPDVEEGLVPVGPSGTQKRPTKRSSMAVALEAKSLQKLATRSGLHFEDLELIRQEGAEKRWAE